MAVHDPQMLKGVLSMVLLRLLRDRESYGYEIVTALRESGLDVAEASVYPALTRMEAAGLLTSSLQASAQGPARKYYRATADGDRELTERTAAWNDLVAIVHNILHDPMTTDETQQIPTDSLHERQISS